jgi:hypothetical protein
MKPLTEDRGYDNVLLGQDYRTPRGAVIDEYGAIVEWWLAGENWSACWKHLFQCHFVHYWSHLKLPSYPGLNQDPRCQKRASIYLICGMTFDTDLYLIPNRVELRLSLELANPNIQEYRPKVIFIKALISRLPSSGDWQSYLTFLVVLRLKVFCWMCLRSAFLHI